MSSENGSYGPNGHANGNGSGNGSDAQSEWDPEKALKLIGALVFISIVMIDQDEEPVGQWQGYGTVSRANYEEGLIAVDLQGSHEGEETSLPPVTSAFEPAEPGTYTIEETGESVVNPDYTVYWTVSVDDEDDEEHYT